VVQSSISTPMWGPGTHPSLGSCQDSGMAGTWGRRLEREGWGRGWGRRGHSQGGLLVDFIDIVKDPVPPNEYKTEEDPKLFHSTKTQRGPLSENWIEEYKQQVFPIMCAYKLCKVEFRYWGMQSKIERFIHDTGEGARLSLCVPPSACRPPTPRVCLGLQVSVTLGR